MILLTGATRNGLADGDKVKKSKIASSLVISLVLVSLAFSLMAVNPVSADSTSIKYAGMAVDDSSVGSLAWTNPSLACTDDGNAAYFGYTSGTSHYLELTDFGFNIPNGSVITGIVVYIKHEARASYSFKDVTVKLVQDGNPSGTNEANGALWTAFSWETFTYGSSSDLWGLSWTASQINSTSFGVVLSAQYTGSGVYGWVDYMGITVYYTAPTTGQPQASSSLTSILLIVVVVAIVVVDVVIFLVRRGKPGKSNKPEVEEKNRGVEDQVLARA